MADPPPPPPPPPPPWFSLHGRSSNEPDPSTLTTQLTFREIASLEKIITTRLDAMDRAMVIFQDNLTRVPTDTDKQVGGLRDLMEERFKVIQEHFGAIDVQFRERAALRDQAVREGKEAVAAAFQAARDSVAQQNSSNALAIAKSEASMVKQVDQLQILLHASIKGLEGNIADIKDRLTTIEGQATGSRVAHTATQSSQIQWVGIIAALFGIVFGVSGIILALSARNNDPPIIERVIEELPRGTPRVARP